MNSAPIFVVDDDPAVRKSLSRLLRAAGREVQAFDSAQAFLDVVPAATMGCVIVDVAMPGMDGVALQAELARRATVLGLIFLTGHGDLAMGVNAMKVGAVDFLTKPVEEAALLEAVAAAQARSARAHATAAERGDILQRIDTLTPREREVMALVVAGHMNKQIAEVLGTVEKTVKVHRARVMDKMRVRSVAELARLAERIGPSGRAG